MTETESVKTVVRILKAAEAKVVKNGGTVEKFKSFLNSKSPNYVPEVIAAAIEDTQREMVKAIKNLTEKNYGDNQDGRQQD